MSSLNYSINVCPRFQGPRENKSLSTSSLSVVSSITTKYLSDVTIQKLRQPFRIDYTSSPEDDMIKEHSSGQQLLLPCYSFISTDVSSSLKVVSEMIYNVGIPFALDRVKWRVLPAKDFTPVANRDDLVQKILDFVRGNILAHVPQIEASPYKEMKLSLIITKEIILPHHEFKEMVDARRLAQLQQYVTEAESWTNRAQRNLGTLLSGSLRDPLIGVFLRELAARRGNSSVNSMMQRMIQESAQRSAPKPIPAAKSSIEALQEVVFEGQDSTDSCAICMEKIAVGSLVVSLPCSHKFNKSCIVTWLEMSHMCPLCRFKMPVNDQ